MGVRDDQAAGTSPSQATRQRPRGRSERPAKLRTAYPVGSGCSVVIGDLRVGGGIVEGADPEQGLEGGHGGAATVVTKDVGSGRGAVSAFRLVRFPDLPTESGRG